MTTEHRTRSEGGARAGPGTVVNASSAGKRRSQRKCHKAASVIDRNSAVVGSIGLWLAKRGSDTRIPFGPFLAFGTVIALLWGPQISPYMLGGH